MGAGQTLGGLRERRLLGWSTGSSNNIVKFFYREGKFFMVHWEVNVGFSIFTECPESIRGQAQFGALLSPFVCAAVAPSRPLWRSAELAVACVDGTSPSCIPQKKNSNGHKHFQLVDTGAGISPEPHRRFRL